MIPHPIRLVASVLAVLAFVLAILLAVPARAATFDSELHRIRAVPVASGLEHPWGLAFLPGGDLLVTERPGRLRRISGGRLVPEPIAGLPTIIAHGQGGLLDVALHPRFESNRLVYLTYVSGDIDGIGTELARGRLEGNRLTGVEILWSMRPRTIGGRHFGSRIRFLPDGTLLMTLGDRGDRPRAQDRKDPAGSTLRLTDDGRIPPDNPFANGEAASPEIFTIGNRNVQGLAIHPSTGEPWSHEHGPQGGDEINVLRPGTNYGWPRITFGRNYGIGTRIGIGTAAPGMAQPVHYWDPSIAPSGMAFYTGARFPAWRGDLFVGALKYRLLVRLRLDGDRVVHEERLLERRLGRIRDVRSGPDGYLYLLTDERDGAVYRLEPAD